MIGYVNPNLVYLTFTDEGGYDTAEELTANLHLKSDDSIISSAVVKAKDIRNKNGYQLIKGLQNTRAAILLQATGNQYYAGQSFQLGLQQLLDASHNTMWATADHTDVNNRDGRAEAGYERAYAGRFVDPDYLTDVSDKATAADFIAWLAARTNPELLALSGD